MNTTRNDTSPAPIDEHDWQMQEAGLARAVHRGDALLAQALRTQPVSRPPADFAAAVARLAASGATASGLREESKADRVLLNVLVAVFAVSAVVVAAIYGSGWLAMSGKVMGSAATQWLLAGTGCLGLSWAFGGARRLFEAHRAGAFDRAGHV